MWGKHNDGKARGLCPLSFGAALGITVFLAMLCWFTWMMIQGVPEMVGPNRVVAVTWGSAFAYAFLGLIKGFFFGLVLALLYDLFVCCCKMGCCRKDGMAGGGKCGCGCGCSCCNGGVKTVEGTSSSDKFRV